MENTHKAGHLKRDRCDNENFFESRYCNVVAAVVGSAVVGAAASRSASKRASASNAASTSAAANAAAESEETAHQRLAFDIKSYDDGAADRTFASELARTTATEQAADRVKYNALQDEQIVRGRTYQAAEDEVLAEAEAYDTEAQRERMAGMATASVSQAYANAKGQSNRDLNRRGVNPASGNALARDNQGTISLATGMAGAANGARLQAETTGYARKMDALGLGKGLIGNQATQAGLQLTAGNSSVNNSLVPINVSNNANATMSAGYGNASNAFNNSANVFGNVAGLQSSNFYNAQSFGRQAGQDASSAVMKGYGMYTGQYSPFA